MPFEHFDIGENLTEIFLAVVALVGTIAAYYFGYKRGVIDSLDKNDDNDNK